MSFDVESLFTTVPIDLVIEATQQKLAMENDLYRPHRLKKTSSRNVAIHICDDQIVSQTLYFTFKVLFATMNNHNLFYDENNIIEHVSASVAMIPKGSPQNVRRGIGTSFDFLCFDQAFGK